MQQAKRPQTAQKENHVLLKKAGGGGGIRTLDRLAPITVFETAAFDHSATPPVRLADRAAS